MFKFSSILIYGMFVTMLVCCQNSTSTTNSANRKNNSIKEISEKSLGDAMPAFSDSLIPLETIVKERKIENKELIDTEITDIQVYLLPHDYRTHHSFLMAEIVNHTPKTITLMNDVFLLYNEYNNSWTTLRYPDNYSRPDITQLIYPGKTKLFRFYFPLPSNSHKGKYRLQLAFSDLSYDSYYYIYKDFLMK